MVTDTDRNMQCFANFFITQKVYVCINPSQQGNL